MMSEFKELIKSFSKTREYVRDFFVYGFKTREDFTQKSARTYDNERRRLERWLSDYVRQDYTAKGKNISLDLPQNSMVTTQNIAPILADEICHQIVLILKILVKAAPGDLRVAHDLVDGGICKAHAGKFPPGGVQKALFLFLRQPEEGFRAHLLPPLKM